MINVAFCAAFVATAVSMIELTKISIQHHDALAPVSLSELAAAEDRLLVRFRYILFVCATLFAVSMYGFIVPRLNHGAPAAIVWTIIYLGILLTAMLPARSKTFRLHFFAAQIFGLGMLGLACIFWLSLPGLYGVAELGITAAMSALAVMTFADKKRFIVYELGFIYLNHLSIVVAAVALLLVRS